MRWPTSTANCRWHVLSLASLVVVVIRKQLHTRSRRCVLKGEYISLTGIGRAKLFDRYVTEDDGDDAEVVAAWDRARGW